MIVLCPKAFAGKDLTYEKDFLMYYLSRTGKKATVANEVWSAFRFRHIKNSSKEIANRIIVNARGVFEPENVKLNTNFEEEEPKDCEDEEMHEKTKSLVIRKWADIEFFITQEPEKYDDLEYKPKIFTLQRFMAGCMGDSFKRTIVDDFMHEAVYHKDAIE